MRFAFKTAPQNTTWADMLAVWQEADDIELFESGWLFDHFYPIAGDPAGPCLEGWTALAALAQATTRLRLGHAGHRDSLPAPGRAGQHGRGHRRHLRRPARARHRRGLEPAGVRRLRHRAGHPARAQRPVRGSLPGAHQPALAGDDGLQRPVLPAGRGAQRAEGRRSGRTRRSSSAAAASAAPCAPPRGTPSTGTSSAGRPRSSPASGTCCTRTAATSAATRTRSPCPATSGSRGPTSPAPRPQAAAFAEHGLDLAIVYLRPPLSPAILAPLADALAPLR